VLPRERIGQDLDGDLATEIRVGGAINLARAEAD
jgi:hypothetical protein